MLWIFFWDNVIIRNIFVWLKSEREKKRKEKKIDLVIIIILIFEDSHVINLS